MPAQGNALGWRIVGNTKPRRGGTIQSMDMGPPLQGFKTGDVRYPGRRSRWSLALG